VSAGDRPAALLLWSLHGRRGWGRGARLGQQYRQFPRRWVIAGGRERILRGCGYPLAAGFGEYEEMKGGVYLEE